MTHIIEGVVKTKKALKEAARDASLRQRVFFSDPSIFPGAWSGCMADMPIGKSLTCTNHPKRSWFASVKRTGADSWRVE